MTTDLQYGFGRAANALIVLAGIILAIPVFWVFGGVGWLDKSVIPPRRPSDMPKNSVWIDAPPLPLSWHHGWWFGCGISQSGSANYCRLVTAGDKEVYASDYLPCGSKAPLSQSSLQLVSPPDTVNMWIVGAQDMGIIGLMKNGEILLPVGDLGQCDKIKASLPQIGASHSKH